MIRRFLGIILRQYNIGVIVGAARDSAQRVQFYIMGLIFVQTTLLAYSVESVQSVLGRYIPWLNFYWLAAFLVMFVLCMMLFDYKFILPSTWSFVNRQMYKHKNPLLKAFKEHKKELNARLDVNDKKMDAILAELIKGKKGE